MQIKPLSYSVRQDGGKQPSTHKAVIFFLFRFMFTVTSAAQQSMCCQLSDLLITKYLISKQRPKFSSVSINSPYDLNHNMLLICLWLATDMWFSTCMKSCPHGAQECIQPSIPSRKLDYPGLRVVASLPFTCPLPD